MRDTFINSLLTNFMNQKYKIFLEDVRAFIQIKKKYSKAGLQAAFAFSG